MRQVTQNRMGYMGVQLDLGEIDCVIDIIPTEIEQGERMAVHEILKHRAIGGVLMDYESNEDNYLYSYYPTSKD